MLATKTGVHVIDDVFAPTLLSVDPLCNVFSAENKANIILVRNEAVQAGGGSMLLCAMGQSDQVLPTASIAMVNREARRDVFHVGSPASGTIWRVAVPASAVLDTAGDVFPGIVDGQDNLQT